MVQPKDFSRYTLVGAEISLYSGKIRTYLRHKNIPFVERGSSFVEYFLTFPRRTGASAVPVVITPEGDYLQDTSCIIDVLEQRFPANCVHPQTPVLRIASYLFELWGDEFWLPLAMHTRWSHPENRALFVRDVGEGLLAGFPRWIRDLAGSSQASRMSKLARRVGVSPDAAPILDRFLQIQLDALDAHFANHPFLFGCCPSLGDFGMIGPLYAHIGRDPWSKRELVDRRPHLSAWIARMVAGATPQRACFQSVDRPADTLLPALRSIFEEMLPFLQACRDALRATPANVKRPQRYLATVRYPMAGGVHQRPGLSYPVWMGQRLMTALHALRRDEQDEVYAWLADVGGLALLSLELPHVTRIGLAAVRH